ncbi:uncharacterized protein LOC121508255 [Cheilinus undulatus]|uniref:uncharacterized protein LOC121508255 n=1 Tax=Cheilinus undulatus TaxID=241271 RepID=UPI001BD60653|nr:uncharacterized protein LOC121508255 [Cheilinus undulatus]
MELWTTLTIVALLLMSAGSHQAPDRANNTTPANTTDTTKVDCSCSTPVPPAPCPAAPPPSLYLISVNWTRPCEGDIILLQLLPPSSSSPSSPVCYGNPTLDQTLLDSLCEGRGECKGPLGWGIGNEIMNGYDIIKQERGQTCKKQTLLCKVKGVVRADANSHLTAYKVVTALLCCILIILFLIRFTKPTIKALQSRLSDRRQNRWIGPTQSHSVSYHRTNVVQNTEREKRLSYPALERLAVRDSREPSSNRNSDFSF